MYGGAGNAPKVVHVPRSDAVDKTRLLITNVHYEVTVDDLKVSYLYHEVKVSSTYFV